MAIDHSQLTTSWQTSMTAPCPTCDRSLPDAVSISIGGDKPYSMSTLTAEAFASAILDAIRQRRLADG